MSFSVNTATLDYYEKCQFASLITGSLSSNQSHSLLVTSTLPGDHMIPSCPGNRTMINQPVGAQHSAHTVILRGGCSELFQPSIFGSSSCNDLPGTWQLEEAHYTCYKHSLTALRCLIRSCVLVLRQIWLFISGYLSSRRRVQCEQQVRTLPESHLFRDRRSMICET